MKRHPQSGQTIAITLFVTTLILTLCVAVIGSIIKNTREASSSKSYATLYNAAEAGLGMGQREVNRAAYYMVNLIWSSRFNASNSATVLNVEYSPADNDIPLKLFEHISKIQNWLGLSAADGWTALPATVAWEGMADKYYDFNHDGTIATDETLGGAKDDTLGGDKQPFVTKTWKSDVVASAGTADRNLYRYYIRRNTTSQKDLGPPQNASWYEDKMPLYDSNKNLLYDTPIIKKVFTLSTKPVIRVSVYIRMDLSDYTKGSPNCDCNPRHDVPNDTKSPRSYMRCPRNTVRFLVAAVSESTPEAPSQFAQTNVTVELGGVVKAADLITPPDTTKTLLGMMKDTILKDMVGIDPLVFAPVMDPLIAKGTDSTYPGATISGVVFPIGTNLQWNNDRIYLYERPMVTNPFADDPDPLISGITFSTHSIFFVGFDGTRYRRYYLQGPKPQDPTPAKLVIDIPKYNFYYQETDWGLVDNDGDTPQDNEDLRNDLGLAPSTAAITPYYNYGGNEGLDAKHALWVFRRASGYHDDKGRFVIARNIVDTTNLVSFIPLPGFSYYASVHSIATGPIPARTGLLAATVSKEVVHYK